MYEEFGFSRWSPNQFGCKLFIPDNAIDPAQYSRGGPSNIAEVRIVGDFQHLCGGTDWDFDSGLVMNELAHPNGHLFSCALPAGFPDGYYQYKFFVSYANSMRLMIGDPCAKYGGDDHDNSAFIIGGNPVSVVPLTTTLPPSELIIYELMIDDFTRNYRGTSAPVDAIVDKLDYLVDLGVNAVEFMPWIAWPDDDGFSWGYDPAFYFTVESQYITVPGQPLEKLSRLARLISECHQRGLHVILDIVLQHARSVGISSGFPYYWLWQQTSDSPFVIPNSATPGGLPLDYGNPCTLQFVADVCKYWIDRFSIDGLRFDQVSGFNNPQFPQQGAPALIAELKSYLATKNLPNFSLMLEDTWDYGVIQDTNQIGATNGWFDMFRSRPGQASTMVASRRNTCACSTRRRISTRRPGRRSTSRIMIIRPSRSVLMGAISGFAPSPTRSPWRLAPARSSCTTVKNSGKRNCSGKTTAKRRRNSSACSRDH